MDDYLLSLLKIVKRFLVMVRSDAVETYAPIFLGFWSLEFLEGWLGFAQPRYVTPFQS